MIIPINDLHKGLKPPRIGDTVILQDNRIWTSGRVLPLAIGRQGTVRDTTFLNKNDFSPVYLFKPEKLYLIEFKNANSRNSAQDCWWFCEEQIEVL